MYGRHNVHDECCERYGEQNNDEVLSRRTRDIASTVKYDSNMGNVFEGICLFHGYGKVCTMRF